MKKNLFILMVFITTLSLCNACNSSQKENTTQTCQKTTCKAPNKDLTIQLYSVRDLIKDNNITPLLPKLADMGFKKVEAASYNDGKFYNMSPADFKKAVEATGMKVLSSHTAHPLSKKELASGDFTEALKWWDEAIKAHKAAGMEYIVNPWMNKPETVKDLETYCKYYNEIGKKCKENGIKFGYHNHNFEFEKIEDKVVMYDYMLENTNPEYVFFQMDVYWVVMGQRSPVELFKEHPGRFKILHLKDHKELGQSGMVGFDAILKNAKVGGVENLVVEVEQYSLPVLESVKMSIDYLFNMPCNNACCSSK